ncbi:MAG: SDR family oxidoreductase [Roseomonas sp.]|jgi:3-oxoacyl-[acyl-carrier protein] reductase|nr:SDR family oxidoreductase [Roseomonas sp.]MCA3286285.1 SDR family oxidoreductase [Roseomonas sp.]MCA3291202.1 SDR family oxidoreductase [Roseomonas sp.]MCA3296391.1 SDR family oxidoreductase [Roseomonas sp.]MCA4919256.1 SDR family oxidoreductase [Roseomonas sp.]
MPTAPPRRAIVSGASSGIGEAICQRLLREGWHVTGLSRRAPAWQASGYQHRSIDLADTGAIPTALEGLSADAIIHAAGMMRAAPLGSLDPSVSATLWQLHVEAAERLVNTLLPRLSDGGRILLIGSRAATGIAGRSQYSAGKAALVAMARAWAQELLPRRITVNVVSPGTTDTAMLRDPARANNAPKIPPIGRLIEPEEVAALSCFLLGPEAGAITGQQIFICGGSSL